MDKSRICREVGRVVGGGVTPGQVEGVIEALFDLIRSELLERDRMQVPGVGVFIARTRAAHKGVNPRTGEPITNPEQRRVSFRPAGGFGGHRESTSRTHVRAP